jgi:hypothetical protein
VNVQKLVEVQWPGKIGLWLKSTDHDDFIGDWRWITKFDFNLREK